MINKTSSTELYSGQSVSVYSIDKIIDNVSMVSDGNSNWHVTVDGNTCRKWSLFGVQTNEKTTSYGRKT